VNVPARDPLNPWTTTETWAFRERVLARMADFGFDLTGRIESEQVFTPTDFARRDLAHHGALYGWASHSVRTSLLRPPLRAPSRRDLYFVGGTTHPGGGIPLVLLSGRMVAEMIAQEHA
jgi:phytoene desaturase